MHKKTIIITSVVVSLILLILLCLSLFVKNSLAFAAFELSIANKYKDSTKALQYHDIDKMAETQINEMTDALYKEDAFTIALGSGMLANIKETLPDKIKKDLIDEYETDVEKLSKINDLKILYLCFSQKPVTAKKLIVEKIAKNKIKQKFCNESGKSCYVRVWEKQKRGWRVIDIQYTD